MDGEEVLPRQRCERSSGYLWILFGGRDRCRNCNVSWNDCSTGFDKRQDICFDGESGGVRDVVVHGCLHSLKLFKFFGV